MSKKSTFRKSKNKKRIHGKTKKSTTFRSNTCASTQKRQGSTCYTSSALLALRDKWNARHPDATIKSTNPKTIWEKLRLNMDSVCDSERCWLRQQFTNNKLGKELLSTTFAPKAPDKWKINQKEWLNSMDITNVMRQWEHKYHDFIFIGPSPIDFDHVLSHGECVWNELCNFCLHKIIARGKSKIGIVFNTDPHNLPGAHWVAMFIDINRKFVFYFDSVGDKMPNEIHQFGKRVVAQAAELGITMDFVSNYKVQHQKGNTECGIYTIYMITQLLEGKNYTYFMNSRISDKEMLDLRSFYFDLQ